MRARRIVRVRRILRVRGIVRVRRDIPLRPTVRVRLTLLYCAAFFAAGAVLVMVLNVLAQRSLSTELRPDRTIGMILSSALPSPAPGVTVRTTTAPAPTDLPPGLGQVVPIIEDAAATARSHMLRTLLVESLLALGVVGVLAGGLGWAMAGRALQPIHRITATTRRVADRSLHERIALDGPADEVKELADTFDAMLQRLDQAFDGQRRFVANASHELRTPLAINRTLLEVALCRPDASTDARQLGSTLLAVNERHERPIDGLLTLARSDNELTDPAPVDLAEVAAHVAAQANDEARAAGVDIRSSLSAARVTGDPLLLERLVQNLVHNGVRHNHPAGWVSVCTAVVAGQGRAAGVEHGPSGRLVRGPRPVSSRPGGSPSTGSAARGARGWGCRSCAQWSARTAARCRPRPATAADSSSG